MTEEKHFIQSKVPPPASIGASGEGTFSATTPMKIVPGKRFTLPSETLPAEADDVLTWLARYPIERNHPRALTGTIDVNRSGDVMCLALTETIPRAFEKLVVEGFSAAPVLDSLGSYIGFVDLLDLASFSLRLFGAYREEFGLKGESYEERTRYWSQFVELNRFNDSTIGDALNRPAWSRRTEIPAFYRGFTTLSALEYLARTGAHRVPILQTGGTHRVIGLLTQSMLISLVDQNLRMFGTMRKLLVSNILPGLVAELQTINANDTAMNAFKKMVELNITGLAVVDSNGVLTDSISVRDLRGIGSGAQYYQRLMLSTAAFKQMTREQFRVQTPTAPITVTVSDTLETVIKKMDDGNIHRIFVVEHDEQRRPIPTHCITQGDFLRYLCFRLGLEPTTIQEPPEI